MRLRPSSPVVQGWIGLTGTPGTGKSAIARHLRGALDPVEVAVLAGRLGCGRRSPKRGWVVDLPRLRKSFPDAQPPVQLLVGHLAHLLPVGGAIVLRCHPKELERRLRKRGRSTATERRENLTCEAIDLVLSEALAEGVPVWEVDTTGRTPADVAREVARIAVGRVRPHHGRISWLDDATVRDLIRPPRTPTRSRVHPKVQVRTPS